jgi:transcriptional regulator with XRE-family HTH domain
MPPATPRNRPDLGEPAERWPARLVGGRLREARRARGLTLDGVASSAGFTKSFVSAVERGETSPSIGSLFAICDVLGLAMSALFETADAPESNVVRRAGVEGSSFGSEGVVSYRLSPRGERRAQVIETRIAPGGSPGTEPWSHAGELVMATVIEGSVEFRFGERRTTLRAGDTITYSPAGPHSWRNPDQERPAVALFFQVPAEC